MTQLESTATVASTFTHKLLWTLHTFTVNTYLQPPMFKQTQEMYVMANWTWESSAVFTVPTTESHVIHYPNTSPLSSAALVSQAIPPAVYLCFIAMERTSEHGNQSSLQWCPHWWYQLIAYWYHTAPPSGSKMRGWKLCYYGDGTTSQVSGSNLAKRVNEHK